MSHTSVESADLTWMDGDQPFSTLFDDVYFSRDSGLDETRHVFLLHNQLAERWAALEAGAHFCIAETGFGTGLNLLAAWQLWDTCAPQDACLHFVSVPDEKGCSRSKLHESGLVTRSTRLTRSPLPWVWVVAGVYSMRILMN